MVTIEVLKKTIARMGYKWFEDQPNIIGIRSKLNVADVFNDVLCIVYKVDNKEVLYTATITTDPGVTYQQKLLNPKGCAAIVPNQYINAYKLGLHQGKPDHRALVQVGKIKVYRDGDKDGILELDPNTIEEGLFGCNIHGASKNQDLTVKIGPWSAGCQVHNRWSKKEEMCDIIKMYEKINKGLVSYTLLKEESLIFI
jgi:hypothetical protein